ncbi:MAG: hypothetical protein IJ240_00025 [Clostridia bacterium]|nr:hypothetical protein [Clostridia bacterium]
MKSYCLFCQTQRCRELERLLKMMGEYEVIYPRIVQRKWINGKAKEEIHDYLPGYLFLYTEAPLVNFGQFSSMGGVIRWLGERENGFELAGSDRVFAEMLHREKGLIGIQKVYREGDRILLNDGLFCGVEATIVSVDRRKGRAKLEFPFDGALRGVWIGYDVIDQAKRLNEPEPA